MNRRKTPLRDVVRVSRDTHLKSGSRSLALAGYRLDTLPLARPPCEDADVPAAR
nr:MAG TPA: hypothetical protein [Caudoviricetes sp.]